MSNKFGHRVIGRPAAEQAQIIEKARAQHFGPRVIGQIFERRTEIAEAEKDTRSTPATKRDKAVQAAQAAKTRADTKAKEAMVEAPLTANLVELESALSNNPAFYETLYEAEKQRAEDPRKGALRLFLAFELDHENREERKAEIGALLEV